MTTAKYRIIVPDPNNGSPFFYVCNTLEELCFVHKFVDDYNLYLDVYTNVNVQRAKTPQELHDYHMQLWVDQNPANLYFIEEDHPDYWTPFTDEFFELTKAKTMLHNEDDDDTIPSLPPTDDMPTAPVPEN